MSEEVAIRDRKDRHAKKEKRHKKKRTSEEEEEVEDETTLVKKSKSSKRRRLDNGDEHEDKKEKKEKQKKDKKESRRKSVSFTEDTKNEEDDNSSTTVEDAPTEKTAQPTQPQTEEPEEESPEARKQRKREKRAQRRQTQTQNPSNETTAPATTYNSDDKSVLSYLSQYHTDRSAWKFQKNRESQLLKKALSVDDVPAEYNQALFAYLKGLKSEGARQRLRKNAQDAIKLDEGDAANAEGEEAPNTAADGDESNNKSDSAAAPPLPESSKQAYDDALHRFKGNLNAGVKDFDDGVLFQDADAEIQRRFEKRRRAELVLWTVRGKISKPSTSTPALDAEMVKDDTVTTADKGNKPKKAPSRKKRKNRTMVVEISSSSESSDSE
ncbi:hypothetical protein PISL3812_02955 [Talaromyces islandicus]|uniref:WKF domain-containing protein n=1 Tax=Talaromyces islandicus TaxID=28573 RepID=A0A0U1LS30_TALIS|nr:hypothetical protein PISL3812_02955 [Talaromyces islandicus]